MAVDNTTTMEQIVDYYKQHPEELAESPAWLQNKINAWTKVIDAKRNYASGDGSAQDILQAYGEGENFGVPFNGETEKWLDNEIARENVQSDRDYQTQMRDTSITSTGSQLQQLGLSPSNVIQVGGASSGVTSSPAAVNRHSASQMRLQERMNNYNQHMSLAKSLIGAAGSMASSGIYGASLGAIKNAAAKTATATAHSALQVVKTFEESKNKSMLIQQLAKDGNNYALNAIANAGYDITQF